MSEFPPFLRVNQVVLQYNYGSQTLLASKCRLFEDCLNSIKQALKNSIKICFFANIDQDDQSDFNDHSSVVIYLRDRLLPICSSSRHYAFYICFVESDESSATDLISSIIQISRVRCCSNVSIELLGSSSLLPVEDISNWLTPKTDNGVYICGKRKENRFLRIFSDFFLNTREMWEHLIEARLFYNFAV